MRLRPRAQRPRALEPALRIQMVMANFFRRFVRSERGATTTEYAIVIVVIAGVAIFVLAQLNNTLDSLYERFTSKVGSVN